MELTHRPDVKQKVTLSPQVYQGLTMLSMPLVELREMIEAELLENPVLELDEYEDEPSSEQESEADESEAGSDDEQAAWDEWLAQYEDLESSEPVVPRDPNTETVNTEDFVGGVVSFSDHLLDQLAMVDLDEDEERAAKAVVGSLDADGYFASDLDEITRIADVGAKAAERGLAVVRSLDPPGVGASDAREALTLQVEILELDEVPLLGIIEDHLDDVAAHRYRKIARALHVSESDIRAAVDVLRTLNPRPAGAFSSGISPAYVVPDVTLRRFDEDWMIIPNNDALPVLRVSPRYRSLLRADADADADTVKYVKDKIRGAESFIRNVERRKDTVSRITEIILQTQADFFEDGHGDLRPLRLEDVAVELEVHLSTVSRGVTAKYMATPYGLFELKYFFSGGYRTTTGEDISSTTVKGRIRDILTREDSARPLSDQKIADALNEEGVSVARRTVAKYREELRIEPSWARRRR